MRSRRRADKPILLVGVLMILSPLAVFGAIFLVPAGTQVSASPVEFGVATEAPVLPAGQDGAPGDGEAGPVGEELPPESGPTLQVPEPERTAGAEPEEPPAGDAAEPSTPAGDGTEPDASRPSVGESGSGSGESDQNGQSGSGQRGSGQSGSGAGAGGAQCVSTGGAFSSVQRFQVRRMGVDAPLSAVGEDANGAPGAPPLSRLYDTAWYQKSPKPGSTRGNVIINIHSWASGPALGNDLRQQLRSGDVIKVTGADGRVACYRFREMIKFRVADYDPKSGIYHNRSGRPQLAIMTCWDRNPRTGEYESRVLMYADYVARG